ncbi:MAG TPA: hypothetical protein VMB50_01450 [Myxococcales bacterium]|nr:hypothetical protein [Myxococcales bacterium]
MKRTILTLTTSVLALAFAACSNGGGSDGGTTTSTGATGSGGSTGAGGSTGGTGGGGSSTGGAGGGINITLATIGVAPEAVAALAALTPPRTPPSLAAGYDVLLQAVTIGGSGAKLTQVGSTVPLDSTNDTGPITFSNLSFSGGIAALGVISAIVPSPDGGVTGNGFPTCDELYNGTDGGFQDYFVTAASQVKFGTPTADITNAVSFALPASYVALLDCAAGQTPGTFLTGGVALAYMSNGSNPGTGTPVAGVTLSGSITAGLLYYPGSSLDGYAAGSASAAAPTGANGVVTITNNSTPSSFTANGAGFTNVKLDLATASGSVYQVFYTP